MAPDAELMCHECATTKQARQFTVEQLARGKKRACRACHGDAAAVIPRNHESEPDGEFMFVVVGFRS